MGQKEEIEEEHEHNLSKKPYHLSAKKKKKKNFLGREINSRLGGKGGWK